MFMKKTASLLLIVFLALTLAAGCSSGKKPQAGDDKTPGNAEQDMAREKEQKIVLDIYFTRDNNGQVEPVRVTREVAVEEDNLTTRAQKALEYLDKGPTDAEKKQGLSNALPKAQLLGLEVLRPHLILNFSREFEQVGGSTRLNGMIQQLTMTMTAIPGIKSVILEVEGEKVGTSERPFAGEGLLFNNLTPPVDGALASALSPAGALDLFISVIPDTDKMWALMGPKARNTYQKPSGIEYSAFSEGLGSWKNYVVVEEKIAGDTAQVTIKGDQVLEGNKEPGATLTAHMVKEDGRWKWDFPEGSDLN